MLIFIGAWPFAHEHQFGARIALPEYNMFPAIRELAAMAVSEICPDFFKGLVLGRGSRSGRGLKKAQ